MYNVTQVSKWCEAQLVNGEEAAPAALFASLSVKRMTTLSDSGPEDVAFFFSKEYQEELFKTRAGVIVTGQAFVEPLRAAGLPQWKTSVILACPDPYTSMARLSGIFSKIYSTHDHQEPKTQSEIHPSAVIDPTAVIGKNVKISAGVVIDAGVKIGDQVVLYPHVTIAAHAEIGEGSVLFPKVTVYERTLIGKHCRIHANSVLGADGFGYAPTRDPATGLTCGHTKIYHLGRVVLEDNVEVGACTTIDRGTFGDTIIRKGAKIDNQVQVGHNAEVCEGAIICGCAGMAGSTRLGKFAILGPQGGIANKVHVGDYSMIASYSAPTKDVPAHAEYGGYPARPLKDFMKVQALQSRMLKERGRKS
jgi:UDP-3-O-[3-hydroxymyristoyl] glucosamine N-acyltransferase